MKKAIAYIMVAGVLITIGVLGYIMYNKFLDAEKVRKRIAELPDLALAPITIAATDSFPARPVVINYFNSKCRFCQSEIQSIQEHPNLSKQARILLVSDESKRRIQLFTQSIGLDTAMVEVAWDSSGSVKRFLGVKGVPTTFVYGKDSLLVEIFKGETKADLLYDLIE